MSLFSFITKYLNNGKKFSSVWSLEYWRLTRKIKWFSGKPISSVEIYNLSKKLKNKKASSVDSLSNEIIKLAVKALPLYFVKIFNMIQIFYQK